MCRVAVEWLNLWYGSFVPQVKYWRRLEIFEVISSMVKTTWWRQWSKSPYAHRRRLRNEDWNFAHDEVIRDEDDFEDKTMIQHWSDEKRHDDDDFEMMNDENMRHDRRNNYFLSFYMSMVRKIVSGPMLDTQHIEACSVRRFVILGFYLIL